MTLIPARSVGDATEVDTHDDEVRGTMRALAAKYRRMVGSYDMAHAPLVLGAYRRFQQAITDHGTFDMRTHEAIALTVAAAEGCADCQFPHTVGCRALGWSAEQIIAVRRGAPIADDEKTTALLAVARQFAGHAGAVREDIWEQARLAGWTVDELAELFTHVFVNIFTNYLSHYADTAADTIPASPRFHEIPA